MKFLLAIMVWLQISWASENISDQVNHDESEALVGFYTNDSTINFVVKSFGCTTKESFKLELTESYPMKIKLVRTDPDYCKAMPTNKTISFDLQQIGLSVGEEFYISNEFIALLEY